MYTSSIIKAGLVAFAFAGKAQAVLKYTLDPSDNYSGADFFDMWEFMTDDDPTRGFVDYQSKESAATSGLTSLKGSQNFIGVDTTKTLSSIPSASNRGRASVRIESKKKYTHGLVIADLAHMPGSVCGTWPAFWSVSHDNYPQNGEIDMLEGIHEQTQSFQALHTSEDSVCTIAKTKTVTSANCDDKLSNFSGCTDTNTNEASYGTPFNQAGGGVIAMEWTSESIKMWSFKAGTAPASITSGNPDISTFGTPSFTTVGGDCSIKDRFKEHQLVFDTTFCGSFAGLDQFWEATSCFKNEGVKTCNEYVATHPEAFKESYWLINSVKVYKQTEVVASSSSSIASSTTTTSSSSSSSSVTTATSSSSSSVTSSATSTAQSSIAAPKKETPPAASSLVASSTATSSSLQTSISETSTTSVSSSETSTITSIPGGAFVSEASSSTTASTASVFGNSSVPFFTIGSPPLTSVEIVSPPSDFTISTVFATRVSTVTSCAATVTNCPAESIHVTTMIIPVSTTICPVSKTTSPPVTYTVIPMPAETTQSLPAPSLFSTQIVFATRTYTITACPASVTNCPVGQVATTVYPVPKPLLTLTTVLHSTTSTLSDIPIVPTPIVATPAIPAPVVDTTIIPTPVDTSVIPTPVVETTVIPTPVDITTIPTPVVDTPVIPTPVVDTSIIPTAITATPISTAASTTTPITVPISIATAQSPPPAQTTDAANPLTFPAGFSSIFSSTPSSTISILGETTAVPSILSFTSVTTSASTASAGEIKPGYSSAVFVSLAVPTPVATPGYSSIVTVPLGVATPSGSATAPPATEFTGAASRVTAGSLVAVVLGVCALLI